MVPNDTNATRDVFVHDRQTGTTERLLSDSGAQLATGAASPDISPNGRYVAFITRDDAAIGQSWTDGNGAEDIYLYDRNLGRPIALVSALTTCRARDGGENENVCSATAVGSAANPSVANNGNVAFDTAAWAPGQLNPNRTSDVAFWNGVLSLASAASPAAGGGFANGTSADPSISSDGQTIAFESAATNLTESPILDTNGVSDIFYQQRLASGIQTMNATAFHNGAKSAASLSDDGHIAFVSNSTTMSPDDTYGFNNIYEADVDPIGGTGCCIQLSYNYGESYALNGPSNSPAISPDGRYTSFATDASDLVVDPNEDLNGASDVFVHAFKADRSHCQYVAPTCYQGKYAEHGSEFNKPGDPVGASGYLALAQRIAGSTPTPPDDRCTGGGSGNVTYTWIAESIHGPGVGTIVMVENGVITNMYRSVFSYYDSLC